ncbi:MAG: thioredoxin [Chlorobi bacterium]|nr:thioredoxin [Chlorobiota bacterium]
MANETPHIVLNYPNFDEVVANSFILVDFWAEWCQPCKVLEPILSDIAYGFEGNLKIGKVNVDDNRALATKYGVMNIPTLILFKNGKRLEQITGLHPKDRILSLINKHI